MNHLTIMISSHVSLITLISILVSVLINNGVRKYVIKKGEFICNSVTFNFICLMFQNQNWKVLLEQAIFHMDQKVQNLFLYDENIQTEKQIVSICIAVCYQTKLTYFCKINIKQSVSTNTHIL